MEFLRNTLGIESATVDRDVDLLALPGGFELMWVGSVVTHLEERLTRTLVQNLLAACNPGGLLAVSFHGRYAIARQERAVSATSTTRVATRSFLATRPEAMATPTIRARSPTASRCCSPRWFAQLTESLDPLKAVLLSERAWDGHHDVIVLQRGDS
jgi:hypothetical protein